MWISSPAPVKPAGERNGFERFGVLESRELAILTEA